MMNNLLQQMAAQGVSVLNQQDVTELESILLDDNGNLKPAPAASLINVDKNELRVFCHKHGIYSVPSIELISVLDDLILDKDKAIEIGAGNGVYGRALGIKMFDNYMQSIKNAKKFRGVIESYAITGQPLVQYGDDVIEMDGNEAIRLNKPETLVMAWVTHKYKPSDPTRGGNMFGVDMEALMRRKHLKRIILIGNKHVHANSPLMNYPHREKALPEILFSRATHDYLDRVFIWELNQ